MFKVKKPVFRVVCAAMLILCASVAIKPAAADMMLFPLRVFFKDGERMKGLTVLNTGNVQAIYRLELQHKRQLPTGAYADMEAPADPALDPAKWLVYSPRQVDLQPQGKQGIKLSLRRPPEMPDGEYRVHAALTRIARDQIENTGENAPTTAKMMLNVGVAVPVVIRKGKYDTTASILGAKVFPPAANGKDNRSQVELQVNRKGKYSAVGKIEAFWTPPGGDEIKVNKGASFIIYPEVDTRTSKIFLDRPIQGGTLRIVFRGDDIDKGVVFDEKTFPVQ